MRHLSATMRAKTTLWMCVALAAGILAAFLVVVLGTPTKRAEAAFPGNDGKIAFVRSSGGSDSEIFTMKPNGDNQTQLTNNRADDFDPTFSPTGRKIAFVSRPHDGNSDIFTMSANGTDKKQVTTSAGSDYDPAWSPDGTKIAFVRERKGDIYIINKDGTGLTRLTTSPTFDSEPAWSPDGTRIAFVRGGAIYLMKPAPESATNRPQRLTNSASNVFESDPAWSPDGTKIAFDRALLESHSHLYSIRADGSDLISLTNNFRSDADPAWSPDGTRIVFWGRTQKPLVRKFGIYVMKAAPESETNTPKRLTGDQSPSFEPDWQPLR